MSSRHVTPQGLLSDMVLALSKPTPLDDDIQDPERYRIMRLCPCADCSTSGKVNGARCKTCRGEGRQVQEVATCGTPEAVGVAIVTLSREGEFDDCPFGLIDRHGEKGRKWLVLPFKSSPRNVSDAARTLAQSKSSVPST